MVGVEGLLWFGMVHLSTEGGTDGFGFRVSGFGFRVSDFGVGVSGSKYTLVRYQPSPFGLILTQPSPFGLILNF